MRKNGFSSGIIFLIALLSMRAYAGTELRGLYRGARATAMGGAFVAIADDEEALFYNPAGAAGFKKYNFNIAGLNVEASNDILTQVQTGLSAFSNPSITSFNNFIGKNADLRAQFISSFTGPKFGIAFIQEDELAFRGQNLALPQVEIGYQFTRGFQGTFATSVLPKSRKDKYDLRFGASVKMISRRGGYHFLGLNQLLNVNQNSIDALTGNYETAFGFDLGTQFIYNVNKRVALSFGVAVNDAGDTIFGGLADPLYNNFSVGVGVTYTAGKAKLILAYDNHNLSQNTTSGKRTHVGAEISIPVFSIQGGLYQSSFTYGAAVDLYLFKLSAVSYSEDLGAVGGTDTERRFLFQTAFKIGI